MAHSSTGSRARRAWKIAPSLMCADLLHLGSQLQELEQAGADYLHVDIMDGHYVPNFTLGPDFCRAVAEHSSVPMDIHLMIEDVERYVPAFAQLPHSPGAVISFHPEACYHPQRTIQLIRGFGLRAGLAIGVATGLEQIRWLLPDIELLCVMTVNPGYAGQPLVEQTLEKLWEIAEYLEKEGLQIELEVDGNVSWENIPRMAAAGATVFVAGSSSLFEKGGSIAGGMVRFRSILDSGMRSERWT